MVQYLKKINNFLWGINLTEYLNYNHIIHIEGYQTLYLLGKIFVETFYLFKNFYSKNI